MEEAKAQLIQALNAVHDPASDAHVRRSASDWLQTWQLSVEAWTVSNQLLHDPSIPAHLQFYCSQTLRVKVTPGSADSATPAPLTMQHCCKHADGVLSMLCMHRCRRTLMRCLLRP